VWKRKGEEGVEGRKVRETCGGSVGGVKGKKVLEASGACEGV